MQPSAGAIKLRKHFRTGSGHKTANVTHLSKPYYPPVGATQLQPMAGTSPRLAGSDNSRRKVSDRACCTSPVQAVRPRRAATTRFDDARRASSNHLLLSGKLLRGRAGEVHQGENLQLSLRLGRRAWAQKVCQLVEPAQIACAECAGCARVAGELRSRRATEIYVLTAYAPSGRQACSAEELVRLVSPRACRCTSLEAGDGYGQAACSAARACLVDGAAQSTLAVHDRVPYRCRSVCVCGSGAWLARSERSWRRYPGAS